MKAPSAFFSALFCLFILALPFSAEARHHERAAKKEPPKPQYEAIGAVNAAGGTVTIIHHNNRDQSSKVLRVNPATEIEINGEMGTIYDLKPGMAVEVTLGMDAEVAYRLVATPAKANPKPVARHKHKHQ